MRLKLSIVPVLNRRNALLSVAAVGLAIMSIRFVPSTQEAMTRKVEECTIHGNPFCVMKTIYGLDDNAGSVSIASSPEVDASVKKGLEWIASAQGNDGGWGSGTHSRQDVMDPHAVPSDPATTSLVSMSLLRTDDQMEKGNISKSLDKAIDFLLKSVENCPANQPFITKLENTQPQVKLGRNIDVILTSQFFTNILRYPIADSTLKKRIEAALDKCILRIQKAQDADGSYKDGGWAPVLQSALANNALENAKDIGRNVDSTVLIRGYASLNSNYDMSTNSVVTGKAAGVTLYSLSSTTRSSAKQARRARELITKAKSEGKILDDKVTEENLRKAGLSSTEAKEVVVGYSINEATQNQAMDSNVMEGFGSNGGEEFLSYLMTGESMLMQGGNDWKKWYTMMESKLVNIQNPDGSWNGHHCITSPVFCTATCLLILSIHNDMQFSIKDPSIKR